MTMRSLALRPENDLPALRPAPRFHQFHSETTAELKQELLDGLTAVAASINPKFLYNKLGSVLFDAITLLPEYYPTRLEAEIFRDHGPAIAREIGPIETMIDLGAGDCAKAQALFGRLMPRQYVPIDISVDYLRAAVTRLGGLYPELDIVAIGTDFVQALQLPREVGRHRRLFFYPGSSIGNLTPPEALKLLRQLRLECGSDGGVLIGIDLVKPAAILEPAYDDAVGVTAAFNLNMLRNVNRILGSDFDVTQWRHVACFNAQESRVEMHLRAQTELDVRMPGGDRHFAAGEQIHTECSYKYAPEDFSAMLEEAGFGAVSYWTDAQRWFSVFSARA
jgi:dimethylhistidine N-methyltransferase